MVLIVVNGGPNTLRTVTEYVKVKIPVLILEVTSYFLKYFFYQSKKEIT